MAGGHFLCHRPRLIVRSHWYLHQGWDPQDDVNVDCWLWHGHLVILIYHDLCRLRGHKDNVLLHWRWRNRQWFGNREHQAILDSALETQNRPSLVWEGSSLLWPTFSAGRDVLFLCEAHLTISPLSQVTSARTEERKWATQPGHRAAVYDTLTIGYMVYIRSGTWSTTSNVKKDKFCLFQKRFFG